jgi:hypothetical protein
MLEFFSVPIYMMCGLYISKDSQNIFLKSELDALSNGAELGFKLLKEAMRHFPALR